MKLVDARDDVLRKIWVEKPSSAPAYVLEDVRNAFNQALQFVYLVGPDHFRRQTITVTTQAGQSDYNLDSDVQSVIGPVIYRGDLYLRSVQNLSDFDHYHSRFFGAHDDPSPGIPVAYYVRRTAANRANTQQVTLSLTPPPNGTDELLIDVALAPPAYSLSDLASSNLLRVPHEYAESLFLPVARYYAMRSHFFGDEAHRASLEKDYQEAIALYGISDAVSKETLAPEKGGKPE